MATTSLIPVRQAELWTKKGLGRLGFLIRQARLDLGWSMDRLALAVYHKTGEQIAKKTIGNIENNVGFPQYNSLAAIAALRIVKSATGRPLDHHDFIDIASENYEITPMNLRDMIDCAILINKLSEGEIWRKLEAMKNTLPTPFTLDRLEKIKERQISPTDTDIRIIRELVDPNGEAFDEAEWLQSANLL
jgi:transcriptional regulator with XRE-family HTH domain